MKKVLLLLVVMLGTSVMVSAKTTPTQKEPAKELKVKKHPKHKKHVKKVESNNINPATEKK